ncbi:MAG: WD40 repeat protein, partial [Halioglobus sp.]
VGADGTWTVTPLDPLSGGDNVASITITDPAGEADTVTQTITVIPVGATLDEALGFNPVGPVRLFDTRLGRSADALRDVAKGQISGRDVLEVQLTAIAGYVPGSGVGAVSLNVTSTGSGGAGFITVYPCGGRPDVSSLNFAAGQTVGNAVIAPVSADGTVCFFSSTPTDIVVDMNGWFAEGSAFNAAGPGRVFDTRLGESPDALRDVAKGQISGRDVLEVQLTAIAGYVPGSGVGAVSLNVTSTGSGGAGFITVYPCGGRPDVSSLNFAAGQTVGNAVIAPVSADGTVCFFSSTPTDIVVDMNGWFAEGSAFNPVGPGRVFDTRSGESPNALRDVTKTKLGANTMMEVKLTDLAGFVPGSGVSAVSFNVVATGPDAAGFITVYPCGSRPAVSSVNFATGQTVGNAVIAPVSADGTVCFYSLATSDLIVDINGWFAS